MILSVFVVFSFNFLGLSQNLWVNEFVFFTHKFPKESYLRLADRLRRDGCPILVGQQAIITLCSAMI